MPIKSSRNGIITFTDGTAVTPKTLVLEFDGEFKASVPGTAVTFHKDRGVLPTAPEVSLGEDQEMTLSFKAKVKLLTNAAAASMKDLVNALAGGGFMGSTPWASTVSGSSRLLVHVSYNDGTNTDKYPNCNVIADFTEGVEGSELSFSAVSPHAYPTVT